MHDLQNACTEIGKCYWGALLLDLRVETLEPDIPAPLTYEDFKDQRDPALEAIKKHEAGLLSSH